MVQVTGINREELDHLGDDFTAHVVSAIRATLRTVAADVTARMTVDDLGIVSARWLQHVNKTLLTDVRSVYQRSVSNVQDQIILELKQRHAQVAAGELDPVSELGFELPQLQNDILETYLTYAGNRLVNIGNDVWEVIRGLLIDGTQAGESVREISTRITSATGIVSARAEVIARTEVNAAANIGAMAQIRALRLEGTKTWEAVGDERTRPWHRDADGQTVDITEKFMVGGEAMDQPLDGAGSAGNVVNCRCTASFDIQDDSVSALEPDALVAAAGDVQTGAMIALVPSDADLSRLPLANGEPSDQLHLTLWFLGDAIDIDAQTRAAIITSVTQTVDQREMTAITAKVFGADYWNPDSDTPAWVLAVGDDAAAESSTLGQVRGDIAWGLDEMAFDMPAQHTPWVPHVCLAYTKDMTLLPEMLTRTGPINFDRVRMAFANEVTDVPLIPNGSETNASSGNDLLA